MPQGCIAAIEPIMSDFCAATHHKESLNCLDLGIGFGLWGALMRNYLDGGAVQFKKRAWILGVEGFSRYKSPCWDCYDLVHQMTIQKYLEQFGVEDAVTFDGIFILDVIEHFTLDEGKRILEKIFLLLKPGGRLYVSTPSILIEQGAAYGNKLETHRSLWTTKDLEHAGFQILQDGKEPVGAGYLVLSGVRVK